MILDVAHRYKRQWATFNKNLSDDALTISKKGKYSGQVMG